MNRLSKVLIGIGISLFALIISTGVTQSTENMVRGTNDPTKDVKAVQDAVDNGGIVLLKGKFNFGEKEKIIIKKDIQIVGKLIKRGRQRHRLSAECGRSLAPCLQKMIPLKHRDQR